MERKNYLLIALILFTALLLGCEKSNEEPEPDKKDESVVQLTVKNKSGTRDGSDSSENSASEDEGVIGDKVLIVVFNSNGVLETEMELSLTDLTTEMFRITAGEKFIYAFTNYPSELSVLNQHEAFEKSVMHTILDNDMLPITKAGSFFMGTLWRETTVVPLGGTEESPINIELVIGRLSSKVLLKSVAKGKSNMKGTFSNSEYKLGTVPTKYYLVGQHEGSIAPPTAGHGQVFSAVHEEGPESASSFQSYINYSSAGKNSFYTIENTTKPDENGRQYFGNTTHIMLKTKYAPDASELKSSTDINAPGTLQGDGTFYTIVINGRRVFVDNDPTDKLSPDPDTAIKKYEKGINYHRFAIRDPNQAEPERIYAIIRNHYYTVSVTGIQDLGDNKEITDPNVPIPQNSAIAVVVEISPWSKTTTNEDL